MITPGQQKIKEAQRLAEKVGVAPLLLLAAFTLPCPVPGAATLGGIGTLCPVQRFAHLPCPGCGMTRSVVATAHGQLLTAVQFHPLGPIIFVWIAYAAFSRIPKLWRHLPQVPPRLTEATMAVLTLAILAIWLLRLWHVLPGPNRVP